MEIFLQKLVVPYHPSGFHRHQILSSLCWLVHANMQLLVLWQLGWYCASEPPWPSARSRRKPSWTKSWTCSMGARQWNGVQLKHIYWNEVLPLEPDTTGWCPLLKLRQYSHFHMGHWRLGLHETYKIKIVQRHAVEQFMANKDTTRSGRYLMISQN